MLRLPILFSLLLIAACQREQPSPALPASFSDDLARTVSLPEEVERVAPLAPSLTEVLFEIGAGDAVAAVTTADDYPPDIEGLPRFQALPLDFEALARLRPDVVLATDQVNDPKQIETLADLGIPTLVFQFDQVGDVARVMRRLGGLLDRRLQAEAAATRLERQIEAVRKRTQHVAQHPRVLVLIGPDVPYVFGGASYVNEIVEIAGGKSITALLPDQAALLSEEFVLDNPPDVIVVAARDSVSAETLLEHHPTWKVLPAIEQQRIFILEPDWLLRPGPRIGAAIEALARQFHPDLFK